MNVNCPSYDCQEWQEYDYSGCAKYLGGVRHLVLVKCGTTLDPSDGTAIAAAVAAGNAKVIKDILLDFGAPSPVKVDSLVAGVPQIVATYDRTATLVDRKVSADNVTFYDSINSSNGYTVGGAILYEVSEDRVSVIEAPITLEGGRILPASDGEPQRFEFTMNWRAKNDPAIAVAPTGLW